MNADRDRSEPPAPRTDQGDPMNVDGAAAGAPTGEKVPDGTAATSNVHDEAGTSRTDAAREERAQVGTGGNRRGPDGFTMAVHAGKAFDRLTPAELPLATEEECAPLAGMLLGVVDVTGVHHASHCDCECSRWAADDQWHWVVSNPRLIDPTPWRGHLGLFDVPDDVFAEAVRDARP